MKIEINPRALADAMMTPKVKPKSSGAKAEVTPLNPSRRALKRVKNPLPVPTTCRFCGGAVGLVENDKIYNGRKYGDWPWAYLCANTACGAYVGLHPFTGIPLGTLADEHTRVSRKLAKLKFSQLYECGAMTRDDAYTWLAGQLGIANKEECHIGWFDIAMCDKVCEIMYKWEDNNGSAN